ncbi:hypothetical protein AAE478_004525 [Parahypoxylon ruwenzoriense]
MKKVSADHVPLDVPRPNTGRRPSSSFASFSAYDDPRSSSSQSLVSSSLGYEETGRRKLLVIYIHGFMGSDASFQSFPAHVHKYLKLALSDTHIVHSKIYPRYKTYKALGVARDNFSGWLAPHESLTTDVVLVGHSMGGLLAADVALMPSRNQYRAGYFLHRILGTVNLDAPLLGLHPSVITAGISSLFRPKSDVADLPEEPIPEDESSQSLYYASSTNNSVYSGPSSTSQASLPSPSLSGMPGLYGMTFDPNFNPSFVNDVRIQDRGWLRNIAHFIQKHNSEGLLDAATYHITSHLEFGSCLMDTNGLKTRYENIRRLEDVDDLKYSGFPHVPPRVRFIQYYTICHGYPKKPKHQTSSPSSEIPRTLRDASTSSMSQTSIRSHSNPPSPQDPIDSIPEEDVSPLELLAPEPILEDSQSTSNSAFNQPIKLTGEKVPESTVLVTGSSDNENGTRNDAQWGHESSLPQESSGNDAVAIGDLSETMESLDLNLPTIPELPMRPELLDLDRYSDKDARKQAEKEAKQAEKDYAKRVKNRDKAIKEREKIIDKRKKKLAREAEKQEKEEQKRRRRGEITTTTTTSSTSDELSKIAHDVPTAQPSGPLGPQALQGDLDSTVMSPEPSPFDDAEHRNKYPKKLKERKFCNLPHKVDGEIDSKWVKIFMKDTDQVGAHTGLFFNGEHYERLVGDVGETIVSWVQEDMTRRAILEMGE